jgi:hypothetical protein
VIYSPCKYFFLEYVVTHLCFECVVTHIFECNVIRITDRLKISFLCKWPSFTSVKLFFSVSTQSQLLEVRSSGDVGIFKPNSVIFFDLVWSFFFSHFFDCYISVRIKFNWIIFRCHYTWIQKPQIDLYISTLWSLHSCTLLTFKYHHPMAIN